MTIATKNGVPIISGGSLARNCACCGPPNPPDPCAACCPSYPSEIQAIISVGSASDVCYAARVDTFGGAVTLRWLRKHAFNQANQVSGTYALTQVSTGSFQAGFPVFYGTPCVSYLYTSNLIAADIDSLISWGVLATLYTNDSTCLWQVEVGVTQTIYPIVVSAFPSPLLPSPPNRFTPLVVGSVGGIHSSGAFLASLRSISSISAACSGGTGTASSNQTPVGSNYTCTPSFIPFGLAGFYINCVVPVDGGVATLADPSVINPWPDVYSVSHLSGAGTIGGQSCSAPTTSVSVTLNT